jgi:hypothetical protein
MGARLEKAEKGLNDSLKNPSRVETEKESDVRINNG